MKVLSLLQPWATLLVQGHKLIETRSWATKYRGPVFIHASGQLKKRFKYSEFNPLTISQEPFFKDFIKNPELLPFGSIIGMVEITDVKTTVDVFDTISDQEAAFGDYSVGRYAWLTQNARSFSVHTPAKGKLSIVDHSDDTNCRFCDAGLIANDLNNTWHKLDSAVTPCTNILASISPEQLREAQEYFKTVNNK